MIYLFLLLIFQSYYYYLLYTIPLQHLNPSNRLKTNSICQYHILTNIDHFSAFDYILMAIVTIYFLFYSSCLIDQVIIRIVLFIYLSILYFPFRLIIISFHWSNSFYLLFIYFVCLFFYCFKLYSFIQLVFNQLKFFFIDLNLIWLNLFCHSIFTYKLSTLFSIFLNRFTLSPIMQYLFLVLIYFSTFRPIFNHCCLIIHLSHHNICFIQFKFNQIYLLIIF